MSWLGTRAPRALYARAALLASLGLLALALPSLLDAVRAGPGDGAVDWLGARAFLDGLDPFSPHGLQVLGLETWGGFGHPPTTPFWFLPLAGLDVADAGVVWNCVILVVLLAHVALACVETEVPAPFATAMLLYAALLSTSWLRAHLQLDQISEAIAFLYVLAWVFLRRARPIAAGVSLGLATTFKLFPGLVVLYLLVTRRFRAVAAAVISYLAIAVLMTTRYGWICWEEFFVEQRPIADRWASQIQNASLHGIVLRLFHPACEAPGPTRLAATVIVALASLVAFISTVRLCRRAPSIDLPFALVSVLSAVLNPWFWEHYNVLLVLPFLVAATTLIRHRAGLSRARLAAGVGALAATVAMLAIDHRHKFHLQAAYRTHPSLHWQIHFFEIASWLPQVLLLGLLGCLIAWTAPPATESANP